MGRRSNFQWAVGQSPWTGVTAGSDALFALVVLGEAQTLRRCIIDFYVQNQSPADGVLFQGGVGIIAVDQVTVTAGVASLPKPITHGDQEWIWSRGFANSLEMATAAGVGAPTLHLHDDVRAMRKMKQTDNLVLVVENLAGAAIRFSGYCRALFSS